MVKITQFFCIFAILILCSTELLQGQEDNHQVIRFGTINSPSTRIYKRAFAVLTEAFRRNELGFSMESLPGKRSLHFVEQGQLDGEAFRIDSFNKFNEYPKLIRVEEPIITIDQSVWSKKQIKVDGWESLKSYSIVYERGTRFIEKNEHIFKSVQTVDDMKSVLKVLSIDRADITITSSDTGASLIKKFHMENSGIKLQFPPLQEIILHPYMNKEKHSVLAVELAQTIREMKTDGTYARIMEAIQ